MATASGGRGCKHYSRMISLYTDGRLEKEEKSALLAHANGCEECAKAITAYKTLTGDLGRLPDVLPDAAFHNDMMARIRKAAGRGRLRRRLFGGRDARQGLHGMAGAIASMSVAVLIFCCALSLVGQPPETGAQDMNYFTQSSAADNTGVVYLAENDTQMAVSYQTSNVAGLRLAPAETYNMSDSLDTSYGTQGIQTTEETGLAPKQAAFSITDDSFSYTSDYYSLSIEASDINNVLTLVKQLGGTVSDSYVSTYGSRNSASLTVSVSNDLYDFAVIYLSGLGTVVNKNESSVSLTEDILNTAARLSAARSEYERLAGYSSRAGDLTSVILLQDRIYSVINDIDYYEGQLRNLYSRAGSSVVYLSVSEASAYGGKPLGQRLKDGFYNGLSAIKKGADTVLVSAAGLALPLFIIAAVLFAVLKLFRALRHSKG